MTQPTGEKRDLVLAPGEYAFLQDETRGQIKVHVGPTVINQTAQDRPVVYNPATKNFQRCGLEQAVVKCPVASEGDYVVLENPSTDAKFPDEGGAKVAPNLKTGRKVNIPGPCTFGLWPTQTAAVIPGHHLRSNQYLLVRVYNEDEARQNWNKTVAVLTNAVGGEQGDSAPPITAAPEELKLTIGKLLIIKGTEVSFYIPPTGVEVVPEASNQYVREAVTLEQLEYCILIDENGKRRYERGPQVVFPKPTEQFYTEDGVRKYRAIELNGIQGIHTKVVAPYTENGTKYDVGTELFITGEDTPIYFPRVEHSIIRYGDKQKHYATAVPAGEGRYVMDRNTGEINTERGPAMLLPDPRSKVTVRRMLSDKQCMLWYPSNEEALAYNRSLREIAKESPSNRSGFVSEGDIEKAASPQNRNRGKARGLIGSSGGSMRSAFPASYSNVGHESVGATESLSLADESVGSAVAETFERGTQYTPPRTITLDTKYDGVPSITIWTGYAVMVVSKTGSRRVVVGPQTVLLDYDESLEVLELSTGKPKTTDKLEKTVYLRTTNNKVSDIVTVTTRDHVAVSLKLSYRINFEGDDPSLWFQVENYVKYLCDHARSILKGVGQKKKVEDFYTNGVDIVRDALLGTGDANQQRAGMRFDENGMRMMEVEVLGIAVEDEGIAKLLGNSSYQVVASNINLHQAEKELEVAKRKEEIEREKARAVWLTTEEKSRLDAERLKVTKDLNLARILAEKEQAEQQKLAEDAKESVLDLSNERGLARRKAESTLEVETDKAKSLVLLGKEEGLTKNVCDRFKSAQGGFTEALATLQNQETLVKVAQAMSVQQFVGGKSLTDVIVKVFQGTGLEDLMKKVDERANNGAALASRK